MSIRHLLFGAALLSFPLFATPIAIVNPSFEANVLTSGNFIVDVANGWTGSTGAFFATFNPTAAELASGPQDGSNVAAILTGNISQTLTTILTANTAYALQVGIGSRSDTLFTTSYQVSLETTDGTVLATASAPLPGHGTFVTASLNFTALAGNPELGQDLVIRLTNTDASGNSEALFDNVLLNASGTVSSVPEPASFGLLIVAAAGMLALRRKA